MERVVPVTARLSRKFYETFGEDVTNELVDWFNSVDATYRADLRELSDRQYAQFDAKLEQRLAQGLGNLETKLVRWMVGLWATALLTMIGLSLPR